MQFEPFAQILTQNHFVNALAITQSTFNLLIKYLYHERHSGIRWKRENTLFHKPRDKADKRNQECACREYLPSLVHGRSLLFSLVGQVRPLFSVES